MQAYLEHSAYIDWHHPRVAQKAQQLAAGRSDPTQIAQACFEFVRDAILHSWDHQRDHVTCRASDVLLYKTGFCYAKSHLLAALLRANGIPAGLCYQRLSVGDGGAPYCLHGLNAVYLEGIGWYRIDARGNKSNVSAQFHPPREHLPFLASGPGEADLPGIWSEPHELVVSTLIRCDTIAKVAACLPDLEVALEVDLEDVIEVAAADGLKVDRERTAVRWRADI